MRKSKFKNGALALFASLAFSLFLPMYVNAQGGGADGFFRGGSEGYENRDGEGIGVSGGITNDSFNAPLGSGLLIMLTAGLGYAFARRQGLKWRDGQKVLVAAILLLGMTQCKKNDRDVIPYNNKAYNIKLDVGNSKTDVNTVNGKVTFEDGDEIVVANNGKYVGTLTYDGDAFSGTIVGANANDYLHFYHLGNKDTGTLTAGSSVGCTVSIADQTVDIPVISCGVSTMMFSEDLITYTARLHNKCALVKFDVSSGSDYAGVCIKGMRNTVSVNFADDSFTFSEVNDGKITLPTGSGERWAVLLPQPEMAAGEFGSAFAGMYSGIRGSVPEIIEGECFSGGVTVTVETEKLPDGALPGLFTVNANGKQVHFSKGNLLYDKNTGEWRFFEEQYLRSYPRDLMVGQDYINYSTVEHFGWGCSGFNHGSVNYKPWQTINVDSYYYAYGDSSKNLNDGNGTADCGYTVIENGGKAYKQWRTFTLAELHYILKYRDGAAEKSSYATITTSGSDYIGLLLLPDNWVAPDGFSFTPGIFNNFTVNTYDVSMWSKMEEAGALFIACNGRRNLHATSNPGKSSYYWTCDSYSADMAYCIFFSVSSFNDARTYNKSAGMAVRLMTE